MTDTLIPDEPSLSPTRRGPGGRLYHGETSIDFYGRRWIGLGISALLLLVSMGALLTRGLNLSLEFTAGTVKALAAVRSPGDIAAKRGKRLEDIIG